MGTYKVIPDQGNDSNLRFLRICASEKYIFNIIMVLLNNTRFLYSVVGASLVMLGVVTKNSLEQIKVNDKMFKMIGMGAFITGWLFFAYSMSLDDQDKIAYLPVIAIVGAVILMKKAMSSGQKVPKLLPLVFSAAWMYLGHYIATKRNLNFNLKVLAYGAPLMVLASMLFALPKQREMSIVDGPGAYLFNSAWGILSVLNAM